jgi:hypothetical protein
MEAVASEAIGAGGGWMASVSPVSCGVEPMTETVARFDMPVRSGARTGDQHEIRAPQL